MRHDHGNLREGELDPSVGQARSQRPTPPKRHQHGDTGNHRRQLDRQVDEGIHDHTARKAPAPKMKVAPVAMRVVVILTWIACATCRSTGLLSRSAGETCTRSAVAEHC